MADLFTKCLGSHLFEKHRRALGFEPRDMPVSMMQVVMFDDDDETLMNEIGPRSFGFVEVCCEPDSQLSVLTLKGGISYVGIVKDVQSQEVLSQVSRMCFGLEAKRQVDTCTCVYSSVLQEAR